MPRKGLATPVSRLRCLATRRNPDIVAHVCLGKSDGKFEWEYELHFSQDNLQQPIVKKERVLNEGEEILTRPLDEDRRDPARLTQTYLEQINANQSMLRKKCSRHEAIHLLNIILIKFIFQILKEEKPFPLERDRKILKEYKSRRPEKIDQLLESIQIDEEQEGEDKER
jgi:hypothetical protein